MAKSCEKVEVQSLEDKMSCAIRALRAFDRMDWKTMKKCRDIFPRLNETIGQQEVREREKNIGTRLRTLVTQLAHEQLQQYLEELQEDPDCNENLKRYQNNTILS